MEGKGGYFQGGLKVVHWWWSWLSQAEVIFLKEAMQHVEYRLVEFRASFE